MYNAPSVLGVEYGVGAGTAGTAAVLAFTGLGLLHYAVAVVTLLLLGIALLKLVPRREA